MTEQQFRQHVAVLGTGLMGSAMAQALRGSGHDVRVWNRTRARAEALAGDDVRVEESVADAVAGADVVITMLFDTDAVLSITDELVAALGANSVWLQCSTVGPDGMQRIAAAADTHRLLDCPVLGSTVPASKGELVGLVSGDPAIVHIADSAMAAMTHRVIDVSDRLGDASRLKLVCNAWVASITAATAQSVALADGLGIDPQLFLDAIADGPTDSPYAQLKGRLMMQAAYHDPAFTLDGMRKDLGLIHAALEASGLRTDLVDGIETIAGRTAKSGNVDMAVIRDGFEH